MWTLWVGDSFGSWFHKQQTKGCEKSCSHGGDSILAKLACGRLRFPSIFRFISLFRRKVFTLIHFISAHSIKFHSDVSYKRNPSTAPNRRENLIKFLPFAFIIICSEKLHQNGNFDNLCCWRRRLCESYINFGINIKYLKKFIRKPTSIYFVHKVLNFRN